MQHTVKYRDAMAALMLSSPFFSTLLLRLKHTPTESIPTLAVGLREFMYNPRFLDSLSAETALAAFAHEVMHAVYQHVPMQLDYFKSGIGPDGKAFDRDLWAQAIDYVVNASVAQAGIGKLGDNWLYDPRRFPAGMTPQEVYAKLKQDKEQQSQQPQQGQGNAESSQGEGGKGQPLDQHGVPGDEQLMDEGVEPAITMGHVINAAETAKIVGGHVPEAVLRMIEEVRRPPTNPWGVLRKFISELSRGKDTTSYRRLNRRMITRGIGMPGQSGFSLNRVGIVVDVSGSIGQAEVDLFAGHMAAILSEYRPKEVRVAWTDTTVHRIDTVRNPNDIKRITKGDIPGGGGTNLPVAFDALGRCDVVIFLTDGYTPYGTEPKVPTVWAMTTKQIAPYGLTVNI